MQVTVRAAKTNFSKLIEAALTGEEVVIARGRNPVVKLVPIPQGKFRIGLLRRELTGPGPDFLEPLDESDPTLCSRVDAPQLQATAARLASLRRSPASSWRLRKRIERGVTSTSSSSPI